jgi:hypothetical protein
VPRVSLSETYGILGYDEELGRTIELMEKGRGQEYGYVGGSGGQGCLAVAYSKGAILGHDANFPSTAASLMVVAGTSGEFLQIASPPIHYGGVSKQNWFIKPESQTAQQVPYFWVASQAKSGRTIGISTFQGDAAEATRALLQKMPFGWVATGDVGLFPCYTRGVNAYGKENVESNAITAVMGEEQGTKTAKTSTRIYGMFAHGELGPSTYSGFVDEASSMSGSTIPCEKHSRTSILSIHTTPSSSEASLN